MSEFIDSVLQKLAIRIRENRYEPLETDGLEIKPVPTSTGEWNEIYKSTNAFLNTRGGILLMGIKETGQGENKRYLFSGYREEVEPKTKEVPNQFTDRDGRPLNLQEWIRNPQIKDFLGGRVAVLFVDELLADKKFVLYNGKAYKRFLTGDHKLKEAEIDAQEEYREEVSLARELRTVPGVTLDDLDLDMINEYIQQLNRPVRIETIKPDLQSARAFLQRKKFIVDDTVTTLGMLVCGKHPEDKLDFRCHVHGYVDIPQEVAQDK